MRYFKYNLDYYYTGYEDSESPITSSTLEIPSDETFIIWNPDIQTWEVEPTKVKTLDQVKSEYTLIVQNYYDDYVEQVFASLADFEQATFATQEAEWRAYQADINAPTPYVDILCFRRTLTKSVVMEKIGQKVMFFADLQGQMHALEDAITACTTTDEVQSITYPWM